MPGIAAVADSALLLTCLRVPTQLRLSKPGVRRRPIRATMRSIGGAPCLSRGVAHVGLAGLPPTSRIRPSAARRTRGSACIRACEAVPSLASGRPPGSTMRSGMRISFSLHQRVSSRSPHRTPAVCKAEHPRLQRPEDRPRHSCQVVQRRPLLFYTGAPSCTAGRLGTPDGVRERCGSF